MLPNAPKKYETHQNICFGSNGVDQQHSLQKIPTRLCGTNFCTNSARFAPNRPKCTKIVQNGPKHEFRIQWGGSGAFLREIRTRLNDIDFCTSSARFAPSVTRQPIGPKCIQIVSNAQKHEFRVQWGGSGATVA